MSDTTTFPTGTVSFLFTDIEGSTKLAQQYPSAISTLFARHNSILYQAMQANRGYVFQIVGDAFCAAFASPTDALQAAIDAQRLLYQETWQPAPIRVRMGIHTGQAELQPSRDYQGYLTLSHVQRLMSAAHGGQVLLSIATQELVRDHLPHGVTLRDMGERQLKDMIHPEMIYQLVIENLPKDFPPIKTLDIYQHNLPAQITSFIGRQSEMAEIRQLLDAHRLVTVVGSGGVGKSRLSLQVGMDCLNQYPQGVWLVELAPVNDPSLVPQTLLSTFNLQEDSQRGAVEVLTEYLRSKTILLIIDNCEHVIGACAQTIDRLLRACPELRILAGSREALGIEGEFIYRVPSLVVPNPVHLPSLEVLQKIEAIQLFLERAAIAKPGFALTRDNASYLAQICFRLDGIPFAIELAASRVKILSVEQIAARLDDRFRLLTGGARTALPRQQTLRAMIDWSYSLLLEPEKVLFRRLAVFLGGWTLESAEAVCGEEDDPSHVLDLLARLVDKSLVFTEETQGEIRYHRLETIRQYSREKLLETDEVEVVQDRHLRYFVQFAESAEENLKSGNQAEWQRRISFEKDNLRAALEWGLNRNPDYALRIAGACNLFWTASGYSAEGFRWTQKALEQVEKTPFPGDRTDQQRLVARAKARCGLTRLYLSLGNNADAKRMAEEGVALYRQSYDRRGLAFALVILSYPLEFLGEHAEAEKALQESYAIARAEGDTYILCRSLNKLARIIIDLYHDLELARQYVEESYRMAKEAGLRSQEAQAAEILGFIAMEKDDYEAARLYFKESARTYQEIGSSFNVILEKSNLAHLERKVGNYTKALEYYGETIVAFREIRQTGAVCHQLECFGFIALARNEHQRALQLFAAADALREKAGTPMTPDEQVYFGEQLERLRQKLDSANYDLIWSKGHSMSMEEAIALATKPTTG